MFDNIRQNKWKISIAYCTTTYHCIHGSSCPEADESSLYAILLSSLSAIKFMMTVGLKETEIQDDLPPDEE